MNTMFEGIVYKNIGMQTKTEVDLILNLIVFSTSNGFVFERCSDISAQMETAMYISNSGNICRILEGSPCS